MDKMEASTPEWLDIEFITSCLNGENSDLSDVKVNSFQLEKAVPAGNNYGSELFRVKIQYYQKMGDVKNEKTIFLILKGPVQNTITELMSDFFGKAESIFYYEYLPKVKELSNVQFAPKSYFSPLKSVVVLEDLKEIGFSMADRHKQLDFEHCKLYFTISGKLHAVGVALSKKHPELIEMCPNLQEKFMKQEEKARVMRKTVLIGLKCLVKSIEPLNLDEYKPHISSIKKYIQLFSSEKIMNDLMMKEIELQKAHFKSLIHGDCWTTNMMFKYNKSGNPTDIRLLDFQIFNYDAVVADIRNFTWMSANNDVLEHNLDELYNLYCYSLNSTLEELGCNERYSYDRLKKEVSDRSSHILTFIGAFIPLTQAAEIIDNSTMFSDSLTEDQFMVYYQGKYFWEKYPKVLKIAASQGIFDWVENKFTEYGSPNNIII